MKWKTLALVLGLIVFVAALAPNPANALVLIAKTDNAAILPTPTMNTATPVANCDFDQTALLAPAAKENNIAQASTATVKPADNLVAWRSTLRNGSDLTALNNAQPGNTTAITDSATATARSAPKIEAATLVDNYPNPFNAIALTTSATMTADTAESANPGGFNAMPGLAGAVVGDYTANSGGQYLQAT